MTMEKKSRLRINTALTIKLLVAINPKRAASKSYERFALYSNGMSVGAYLLAGGKMSDIKYDLSKGHIELI